MSKGVLNRRVSRAVAIHIAAALLAVLSFSNAKAADLTWGGLYRVEANQITNPELSSQKTNKAYILHHLILSPKVVAADGLTVFSRLDVFNGNGIDNNGVVSNVAGDVIGNGPNSARTGVDSTSGNDASDSNTLARTQRAGGIAVTELYLSWVQEYGQLVVGRAPVQFGLGTAWNAGNGKFDHFIDTKDMVAYKFVLGNFFLMPILGKVNEGNIGQEDDVNDYALQLNYENPDTELAFGLLYQMRVTTFAGNDLPVDNDLGGGNTTGPTQREDGYKSTLMGLYTLQKLGDFRIGVEANILSGDSGYENAAGDGISMEGLGIAAEVAFAPKDAKLTGDLKFGFASGDDPGTPEKYEGFQFSRNYDVALLMFNHPLGQRDFLRSGMLNGGSTNVGNRIDDEAISNAMYIAPSLQYQWKENFSYGGTFVYGMLNQTNYVNGTAVESTNKSLGYEVDLNITYQPFERLTWITQAGFMFPGDAWKGGDQNFDNSFAYGLVTKAAIQF
ncbi:MAG TPA: hypothetical protein VM432_12060 [Bdellovibrionales bacterium]|jgi:hypothetical protein|nr:hypothetical protein [Bdellovibrionales bacterium]